MPMARSAAADAEGEVASEEGDSAVIVSVVRPKELELGGRVD